MKVAVVQMCSGTEVANNIASATALIERAAKDGARLIATPEMTNMLVRGRDALRARAVEEERDATLKAIKPLSKRLGIHILIGSLAIREGESFRNRSYMIDRSGNITARYDKIHMFDADVGEGDVWRESDTYLAGEIPTTTLVDGIKLGMGICYDVRFAELFRHYARKHCEMLSVPAAFTVPTGQAHWHVLLRARAIETGAYIIAPAQGGSHEDGRQTYGHSLIVAPWGEIVAKLPHDRPGYAIAEIDADKVRQARSRVPAWSLEPKV